VDKCSVARSGGAHASILLATLAVCLVAGLGVLLRIPSAWAQQGDWSTPINISNTPNNSWFPDLAVDARGDVHVVWCETTHVEGRGEMEQVLYTRWDGSHWSSPIDLLPPQFFIYRPAIALKGGNELVMVFRRNMVGGNALHYTSAHVSRASSAGNWASPRFVGARRHNYMADLGTDARGRIHLLFDDLGNPEEDECLGGCGDIYYRYSTDGGHAWSAPVNLSRSPVGSSREQMEVDGRGVVYAVWDEGWDRLSGVGEPRYSVYRFSPDGGESWGPQIRIMYPTTGTAQLTVGADGQGGVMLVWRVISRDEIFYQWSTDDGMSWSPPDTLPQVFARPWATPFDMYDMATDSAGHIHLLVVGRERLDPDAPLGVYHLIWDGTAWSRPDRIYIGQGYPEYPKLVISRGNQLYAVWFVRDILWDLGQYEIWYSSSQTDAPYETPLPIPVTPTPSSPLFASVSVSTVVPTLVPEIKQGGMPENVYTERDEIKDLIVALSPIAATVLLLVAVRKGWVSRIRR